MAKEILIEPCEIYEYNCKVDSWNKIYGNKQCLHIELFELIQLIFKFQVFA